jgi:hypothetical protein
VPLRDEFCGSSGARTIFKVHVTQAYKIEDFSDYPDEKEVLFPMLSEFTVCGVQPRLRLDSAMLQDRNSHRHTGEPDIVELRQENRDQPSATPCNTSANVVAPSPVPAVASTPLSADQFKDMTPRQLQAHMAQLQAQMALISGLLGPSSSSSAPAQVAGSSTEPAFFLDCVEAEVPAAAASVPASTRPLAIKRLALLVVLVLLAVLAHAFIRGNAARWPEDEDAQFCTDEDAPQLVNSEIVSGAMLFCLFVNMRK